MADDVWQEYSLDSLTGGALGTAITTLTEALGPVLETLATILETISTVLDAIKTILQLISLFINLFQALVNVILNAIEAFVDSLGQQGFFYLPLYEVTFQKDDSKLPTEKEKEQLQIYNKLKDLLKNKPQKEKERAAVESLIRDTRMELNSWLPMKTMTKAEFLQLIATKIHDVNDPQRPIFGESGQVLRIDKRWSPELPLLDEFSGKLQKISIAEQKKLDKDYLSVHNAALEGGFPPIPNIQSLQGQPGPGPLAEKAFNFISEPVDTLNELAATTADAVIFSFILPSPEGLSDALSVFFMLFLTGWDWKGPTEADYNIDNLDKLGGGVRAFFPGTAAQNPNWKRYTLYDLFPQLFNLVKQLIRVCRALLREIPDPTAVLIRFIEQLQRYVEKMKQILEAIQRIIDFLEALAKSGGYMLVLRNVESMTELSNRIVSANGFPDFSQQEIRLSATPGPYTIIPGSKMHIYTNGAEQLLFSERDKYELIKLEKKRIIFEIAQDIVENGKIDIAADNAGNPIVNIPGFGTVNVPISPLGFEEAEEQDSPDFWKEAIAYWWTSQKPDRLDTEDADVIQQGINKALTEEPQNISFYLFQTKDEIRSIAGGVVGKIGEAADLILDNVTEILSFFNAENRAGKNDIVVFDSEGGDGVYPVNVQQFKKCMSQNLAKAEKDRVVEIAKGLKKKQSEKLSEKLALRGKLAFGAYDSGDYSKPLGFSSSGTKSSSGSTGDSDAEIFVPAYSIKAAPAYIQPVVSGENGELWFEPELFDFFKNPEGNNEIQGNSYDVYLSYKNTGIAPEETDDYQALSDYEKALVDYAIELENEIGGIRAEEIVIRKGKDDKLGFFNTLPELFTINSQIRKRNTIYMDVDSKKHEIQIPRLISLPVKAESIENASVKKYLQPAPKFNVLTTGKKAVIGNLTFAPSDIVNNPDSEDKNDGDTLSYHVYYAPSSEFSGIKVLKALQLDDSGFPGNPNVIYNNGEGIVDGKLTIDGLEVGQEYGLVARTKNSEGFGEFTELLLFTASNTQSTLTSSFATPYTPNNVNLLPPFFKYDKTTQTSVAIREIKQINSSGDSADGFIVFWKEKEKDDDVEDVLNSATFSPALAENEEYVITGLSTDKQYLIVAVAFNSVGQGHPTLPVIVKTDDKLDGEFAVADAIIHVPTNTSIKVPGFQVNVDSFTTGAINITDITPQGAIARFYYSAKDANPILNTSKTAYIEVVDGNDTQLTGLQPDTEYRIVGVGINSLGETSNYSGPVLVRTAPGFGLPAGQNTVDADFTIVDNESSNNSDFSLALGESEWIMKIDTGRYDTSGLIDMINSKLTLDYKYSTSDKSKGTTLTSDDDIKTYKYQIKDDNFEIVTASKLSIKEIPQQFLNLSGMAVQFNDETRMFTLLLGRNKFNIYVPPGIKNQFEYIRTKLLGEYEYSSSLKTVIFSFGTTIRQIELGQDVSGNTEAILQKGILDGVLTTTETFTAGVDGVIFSLSLPGQTVVRYFIPQGTYTISDLVDFIKISPSYSVLPPVEVDVIINGTFTNANNVQVTSDSFSYTLTNNESENVKQIIDNSVAQGLNGGANYTFSGSSESFVQFDDHIVWVESGTYTVEDLADYLLESKNKSFANPSLLNTIKLKIANNTYTTAFPAGQTLSLTAMIDLFGLGAQQFIVTHNDEFYVSVDNDRNDFYIPVEGTFGTDNFKNIINLDYPNQIISNENDTFPVVVTIGGLDDAEFEIAKGENLSLSETLLRVVDTGILTEATIFELFAGDTVVFDMDGEQIIFDVVAIAAGNTEIQSGKYSISQLSEYPSIANDTREFENPDIRIVVEANGYIEYINFDLSVSQKTVQTILNELPATASFTSNYLQITHGTQIFKMLIPNVSYNKSSLIAEVGKNRNKVYSKPDTISVVLENSNYFVSYPLDDNFTIVDVLNNFLVENGDVTFTADSNDRNISITIGSQTILFYFDPDIHVGIKMNKIINLFSEQDQFVFAGGVDKVTISSFEDSDEEDVIITGSGNKLEDVLDLYSKQNLAVSDVITLSFNGSEYKFIVDDINDGERVEKKFSQSFFNHERIKTLFIGGSTTYTCRIEPAVYTHSQKNGQIPSGQFTLKDLFQYAVNQSEKDALNPVVTHTMSGSQKVFLQVEKDTFEYYPVAGSYKTLDFQEVVLDGSLDNDNLVFEKDGDKFVFGNSSFNMTVDLEESDKDEINTLIDKLSANFSYELLENDEINVSVDYQFFAEEFYNQVDKNFVTTIKPATDTFKYILPGNQTDKLPVFLDSDSFKPLYQDSGDIYISGVFPTTGDFPALAFSPNIKTKAFSVPDVVAKRILLDRPTEDELEDETIYVPETLKERLQAIAGYINDKLLLPGLAEYKKIDGVDTLVINSKSYGKGSLVRIEPKTPFLQATNHVSAGLDVHPRTVADHINTYFPVDICDFIDEANEEILGVGVADFFEGNPLFAGKTGENNKPSDSLISEFRNPAPTFDKNVYFMIKDPTNVGSSLFFQGKEYPIFKDGYFKKTFKNGDGRNISIDGDLNSIAQSTFGFAEEIIHRGPAGSPADKMLFIAFMLVGQTSIMENVLNIFNPSSKDGTTGFTPGS